MCIGVATANSILLVMFANDQRRVGMNPRQAALSAGHTRIRPVLMTALAMIIGMLLMALGLGEGGEQNAPLGRAVIGGLILATATTLFIVPAGLQPIAEGTRRSTSIAELPRRKQKGRWRAFETRVSSDLGTISLCWNEKKPR